MSQVSPPKEDVPIYNSLNYYGQGDDDKLNFPIAQGPEVMAQGVYWGDGTFQNTANPGASGSFVQYPTAQGRVDFGTGPGFGISFGAAVQDTPYTGMTTATGTHEPASVTLDGNGQITAISSVNTDIDYVLTKGTDAGTLGITNLGTISQTAGTTGNSLGETTVATNFGGTSGTDTLQVKDSFSGRRVAFITNAGAGSYNGITQTGDSAIVGVQNVQSTANLTLTTWSSGSAGMRITPTTTKMTGGTTTVECDGTTVQIDPSLTVDTNALILEAGLSSTYTLLGNSAITAGTYLSILNPGSASTFALEQLTAGDNGSQSIIITSGGAFGATKNTIQSYDSYRNSALDLYLNPLGGDVFVPTPSTSDNSTKIASTAYVQSNLANYETTANAAATYAPLVSPGLTGVPTAPTAITSTNTTQIATTAYVKSNLVGYETTANAAATYAPLVSPALTGTPTAPTQISTDNSTKIATTAFVQSHAATGYAPIDSPNFTGVPTAPTPSVSTNSTQLATTAFVQSLTNAGRGNPQPGYANAAGYFYTSSSPTGASDSQLLTIEFGNVQSMNQTNRQLGNVTFRITMRAEWNTTGSSALYNSQGSDAQYVLVVFPGRFPNSDWSPSSSRCRWAKNSGGSIGSGLYSITGSNQSSCVYSHQVWANGSSPGDNQYIQPQGSNYQNSIQFCWTENANGVYSIEVEVINTNVYFQDGGGTVSVNFNNMAPTFGGGTNGNNYPKLYG